MPTTQNIVIDLNTRGANPVAFTHQGDTARSFVFEVYNDGEAFTLTGYTAKIGAMLPADRGYYVIAGADMATGAISGNKITVTLPAAYTAKSGNGVLTIILTGSGATIRPINVDFRIQKSADAADTVVGASDFVPVLEEYMSENMETYISEWLDDHPEATTTVQDGSITPPKMNSAFWDLVKFGQDVEIALNTAELLETTADVVYVVNNDSSFGDGGGCWYWTHKNAYTGLYESIGGRTRTDGSYVFAMPNQSELSANSCPKTDIGRVIASYYQRNDMTYGNDYTLYNSVVTNEIDCSAFVSAVLDGISYSLSRYARGAASDNLYGNYAGARRVGGTGGDREALLTWQLAEWFAERKQLFTIPNNAEGLGLLRFGDVLFSGSYDTATGTVNDRYYGINHCMIVLEAFPNDGKILVAQAGGAPQTVFDSVNRTVKISMLDLENGIGTNFHVFARPSYGNGQDNGANISGVIHSFGSVTANGGDNQSLAEFTSSALMTAGNLYTLTVRGTLPQYDEDGCWIYARVMTTSRSESDRYNLFRFYHLNGNGQEATFIGCLDFVGNGVADCVGLEIRLESTDKIGSPSFEIKEIALTEGVTFGAPGSQPLDFVIDDAENFELSRNDSTLSNGKIYVELVISKNTSVTGDKTIGHFVGGVYGTGRWGRTVLGRRGNTDVVPFKISRDGLLQYAATSATGNYYISWEYIPSAF